MIASFHRLLGRFTEQWVLVSWSQQQNAGSVIVGKSMPHDERFQFTNPNHVGRRIDSLEGVTLYPTLRYLGIPVLVFHGWHPDSEKPLVSVLMQSTRMSPDESTEQVKERCRQLINEGWEDGGWDGLAKYVHVDELEKIEGPPPESAF